MKKTSLVLLAVMASFFAQAQTVPGGDMENWRTGTAGTLHPDVIHAPAYWYGADSLIIGLGETLGFVLGISPSVWQVQLFEENTIVHSGLHSAKLISAYQDTLGYFPGILSNATTNISISGTGSISGVSYSGGTVMTMRPTTVSAWVQYYAGKDTAGATAPDTAIMTVQAISSQYGHDSVVGVGAVVIPPTSSWTQITAPIVYPAGTVNLWVDTLRIVFASSGGGMNPTRDSSTLYVDDVTMTDTVQDTISHEAVNNVYNNNAIRLYPNPASGTLYIDAQQNGALYLQLSSVSGAAVMSQKISGSGSVDVNALAPGLYFYTLTDNSGTAVQRGKVSIMH